MGDKVLKIPLNGLKEGIHEFDFELQDSFFEQFENKDIIEGNINVNVLLNKQLRIQTLKFILQGFVKVDCDVCLDSLKIDIDAQDSLYVKFGHDKEEGNDELLIVGEHEGDINLTRRVYEDILLNIPLRKVHPIDEQGNPTCNKEMMQKLEEHELKETPMDHDPRWDKLKDILSNN